MIRTPGQGGQSEAAKATMTALDAVVRSRPLRAVELAHHVPGGTDHIDWMFAADPDATGPLITFRLPCALASIDGRGRAITRLPDHRVRYLDYEGDLGAGRGSVRRVSSGWVTIDASSAGGFDLTAYRRDGAGHGHGEHGGAGGGGAVHHLRLEPDDPPRGWRLFARTIDGSRV
ncbi:MAG: hypothetical protein KDA25_10675 [Phycisphaerales bacterium]|nr:hypothetical protein [Phycisphaerales bacterium]